MLLKIIIQVRLMTTCSLSVYTVIIECILLNVFHIKSDTNNILLTDIVKIYALMERSDKCAGWGGGGGVNSDMHKFRVT